MTPAVRCRSATPSSAGATDADRFAQRQSAGRYLSAVSVSSLATTWPATVTASSSCRRHVPRRSSRLPSISRRPKGASGPRWRPDPRWGPPQRPKTITGCRAAPIEEPGMCTANPGTRLPRNRRLAKLTTEATPPFGIRISDLVPNEHVATHQPVLCPARLAWPRSPGSGRARNASQSWLTISRHSPTIPTSA